MKRFLLAVAALALTAPVALQARDLPHAASAQCAGGYYLNSRGACVRRPVRASRGASANCRDGTYSFSQSRRGTCSHHGGVAAWL
ncbi:MAG: DUF3761 domain-containing protein [Hyphomicrobium sp.]